MTVFMNRQVLVSFMERRSSTTQQKMSITNRTQRLVPFGDKDIIPPNKLATPETISKNDKHVSNLSERFFCNLFHFRLVVAVLNSAVRVGSYLPSEDEQNGEWHVVGLTGKRTRSEYSSNATKFSWLLAIAVAVAVAGAPKRGSLLNGITIPKETEESIK